MSSEVSVCGNVCKALGANASSKISSVSVIHSALYAYVRVTRVCVPTTVVQLQSELDDRVVISQFSTCPMNLDIAKEAMKIKLPSSQFPAQKQAR